MLFSLVAACGGEPKSTPVDTNPYVDMFVPKPYTPVAGFGAAKLGPSDVAKPVAKLETPAVEHWIPGKASECMSLGKELEAKGDHARARELFLAAAKLDKKSAEPHVELARSFIATNEKAMAIKHANKAVKLAPESSQAYNTLGRAELLRYDYDAAILAFRQATELNADNVWAWNNLGLAYLTLKDYQAAVNALVEATSRKGTEAYMWNNLGTAYEQLDQLDDAREAFENGGKLGSTAALASRKRLEGVDTIVRAAKVEKPAKVEPEKTYDVREEMPEVPDVESDPESQGDDEPAVDVTPAPTTL